MTSRGQDKTVRITRKGGDIIYYRIRSAGVTEDFVERWVIPGTVESGDDLVFEPWPPTNSVVVLAEVAGRTQTMFVFHPGDPFTSGKISSWDWLKPCSPELARCVCPKGLIGTSAVCPRHNPFNIEPVVLPDWLLKKEPMESRDMDQDKKALIKEIEGISDPITLWWVKKALAEAGQTVAKARVYGSTELEYAGHVIARIGNREVSSAEAMELQIFHYVIGKVGRWISAVTRGEQVAEDTLLDTGVYVRMVQYIREHNEWV